MLFRPLSEYDITPRPRRGVVEKDPEPTTTGNQVLNGTEWQTTYNEKGLEATRILTTKPGERNTLMDGWDTAYLRQEFRKQLWNEVLAVRLKSEWATQNELGEYPSNTDIVRAHTTGDGKVQEMYSLRNVKRYTKSFNAAHKRRLEEAKTDK